MKTNLFILSLALLLFFNSKAQLSAEFTTTVTSGCSPLSVSFFDLSTGSPISWNWDFGDLSISTQQNPSHTFTSPGTYNVSLTIGDGITTDATSGSITVFPFPAISISKTNVTCNGLCNGTAIVSINGGTPPYEQPIWSDSFVGGTHTGLCAGTYSVSVSDSMGCSTSQNTTISQPISLLISVNSVPESCNGCCDGSATASVSGGTTPYMYQWSNACTAIECWGLCSGVYNLTVTDASGCTNISNVVVSSSCTLTASISATNVSCGGVCDGNLTLVPSGGATPYTFLWSNGATTSTINNLCQGNYYATVTDSNGCISISNDSISGGNVNANIPVFSVSCNGGSDGSATVWPYSGISPFSFQWDANANNQTSQAVNGLSAGLYSVTVTDSTGCTAAYNVTISQPAQLVITFSQTNDVSCWGGNDGVACASTTGGIAPYYYLWSNGDTASCLQGLSTGVYNVTVTDSKQCVAFGNTTVSQPALPLSSSLNVFNTNCGVCNGNATANPGGGVTPYSYQWSPSGSTTQSINGLCAGNYSVTITDSTGCEKDTSFAVGNSSGLTATATSTNVLCFGDSSGTATANPSGGITPYTYLWSVNTNSQITQTATGLGAGTYSVSVSDSIGCTFSASTTVTQPNALNITFFQVDNINCFGGSDGSVCAAATGGSSGYTYLWSNSFTTSCTTGLVAGVYTISVADANNCLVSATTSLTEPTQLIADAGPDQTVCNGNAVLLGGSPTASGGVTPYSYVWIPSTSLNNPNAQNPVAAPGNSTLYGVTVYDANNCQDSALVFISIGANYSVNLNITSTSCGVCNGEATVNASGGILPYTYLWDDPASQTDSTASGLCAGTYSVIVTDSTGCSMDTSLIVGNSSGLTVTLSSTDITCNGTSNGTASAIPSGGVLPYSYVWSNGQTDSTATGLSSGTIICTVTDASGCNYTVSANIIQPSALTLNLNVVNIGCGNTSGSITANASGGAGGYQFSIDSGTTWVSNNLFSNLDSGNYQIILKDTANCQATQTANIIISGVSSVVLTGNIYDSYSCNYGNGYIILNATGGNSPYTYKWINPALGFGKQKYGLAPGSYTVVAIDNNGCTDTAGFVVANTCQNALITGYVFKDDNANCIMETGDSALSNWQVKASGTNTYYGWVNANGVYQVWVPAGNYSVSLVQKPYWNVVCPSSPGTYAVTAIAQNTTDSINFGNQISFYCPNLNVSISSGNLRPCFNATYSVSVQNTGTAPAPNATVDVTLDNGVSYVSFWTYSGITLASQNGNTLTFSAGTINPGLAKYFYITVSLDCSMPLGVTKCVEAHAYPDSICAPVDTTWDRSSVAVEGICQNDSLACFTVNNTGDPGSGDMDGTSPYRIYSNNILVSSGTFQLAGGDSIIICWPANNHTIRLEADQRPGHPGNSHPQASVELCGDPVFTLGQINLVPQDDVDDFIDIDCRVTTASYDPNDKAVQPEGLTSQFHFIDSTDILEYKIQFQNTGTDTAFNVYIYDTLSNFVDVTTFESGASSHPYTYEIAGEGIVRFHFENILLADSNVNEPASHGFVKYEIRQKPGNIKGTKIENTAGIVFDFNEPVITNTTFNTVGNIDSLTIPAPVLYNENIFVKVYPNPFTSVTTFEISGSEKEIKYSLEIFNLVGEKVKSFSRNNSKIITFNRDGISDGIYFYKITSDNNLISAGKIIIQ